MAHRPNVFDKAVRVEEKPEPILNELPERKRSGLPPLKVNAPTSGPEYNACFYKRSNGVYGNKDPEQLQGGRHGLSNRFSGALATGGMWRNNSLNTSVDHPRFMTGTTDWMLKLD